MRLLLVSQDFPPAVGGIQTYSMELARHLARRCTTLHVLAPDGEGAAIIDTTVGATVHRVHCSSDAFAVRAAPWIAYLSRKHGLDTALHAQWMTAGGSLAARGVGWLRRVHVAVHGRELLLRPLRRVRGLQRGFDRVRASVLRSADAVFAVSRYTAGLAHQLGVPCERLEVVPNGTDPRGFTPLSRHDPGVVAFRRRHGLGERPTILSVGRLVPHKGIDTAIEALGILRQRFPNVVYAVAGSGPDRSRLRALADARGLGRHVAWLGRVPAAELNACISACDVFVTLSREAPPDVEGFGVVFLEAGACARPCVGADSGGVSDAVAHGETGFLVPPNAPAAAAGAIARILADRDVAARLGAAGRRRVERTLNWERTAACIHAAMESRADGSEARERPLR